MPYFILMGHYFFFGPKKTPPFLTLLKIKMYNRFSLEYHPPPQGGVRKKKGGGYLLRMGILDKWTAENGAGKVLTL